MASRNVLISNDAILAELEGEISSDDDNVYIPDLGSDVSDVNISDNDSNGSDIDENSDSGESEHVGAINRLGDPAIVNTNIPWTNTDVQPDIINFTGNTGLKVDIPEKDDPFSWLKCFITDELVGHLVLETNRYAMQYFETHVLSPYSRDVNYKNVTVAEMWKYLGICFMTGIDKRTEIQDYWSTREVHHTPWYGKQMPLRRFQQISKFLHFADSLSRPADCVDRLYKIRPILDMLVPKFKSTYVPDREISIDEGMMAWRGRLVSCVHARQA